MQTPSDQDAEAVSREGKAQPKSKSEYERLHSTSLDFPGDCQKFLPRALDEAPSFNFQIPGILPHTDGPAYSPWAAIVSLGSAVVLALEGWRRGLIKQVF